MNEVIRDIDSLRVIQRGVKTGADRDLIVELIDKIIELKTLEITTFENQLEKEFANGSHQTGMYRAVGRTGNLDG